MSKPKLVWLEEYSVGVELIDNQHKIMFETINTMIDMVDSIPDQEKLNTVIQKLEAYKKFHFTTEEKYFDEFNYELAEEHKAIHREYSTKLKKIIDTSEGDALKLAFTLIDFLEDWWIFHVTTEDQKYVKCFEEHGL